MCTVENDLEFCLYIFPAFCCTNSHFHKSIVIFSTFRPHRLLICWHSSTCSNSNSIFWEIYYWHLNSCMDDWTVLWRTNPRRGSHIKVKERETLREEEEKEKNMIVEDIFCSFIIISIFVVPCLHKHLDGGKWMYGCWVEA